MSDESMQDAREKLNLAIAPLYYRGQGVEALVDEFLAARPEVLAAALGWELRSTRGWVGTDGWFYPQTPHGVGAVNAEQTVIVLPPQEVEK